MREIKILEVAGTNYEIGLAIGKATKNKIQKIIKKTKRTKIKNDDLEKKYKKYLLHIEKYPDIIQELKGMADGAEVTFDDIAKLNIVELNDFLPEEECSTFVIKKVNKLCVGHNEDGSQEDDMYLLKITFPSGIKALVINYYGYITGATAFINSEGLFISINAVMANDKQIGMPKKILARKLIELKTLDEVIQKIKKTKRAQGHNYLVIQNNKVLNIETSAKKEIVKELKDNFYHCNNYIFKEMLKYEAKDLSASSFARSRQAKEIYEELKTIKDIKKILSSHKEVPKCFCSHGKEQQNENKTVGSIYVDFKIKKIYVGYGFTCKTELKEINPGFTW